MSPKTKTSSKTKTTPTATTDERFTCDKPCASCPYRKDAPLALWDIAEFRNLKAHDSELMGNMFDCHGETQKPMGERKPCVGWLLDQKRRFIPNIQLRIRLRLIPAALAQFERINEDGLELYRSIDEMIEANYPGGRPRPRVTRR